MSLRRTTNIEMRVPSREVYQTCSAWKADGSTGTFTALHRRVCPVATDIR